MAIEREGPTECDSYTHVQKTRVSLVCFCLYVCFVYYSFAIVGIIHKDLSHLDNTEGAANRLLFGAGAPRAMAQAAATTDHSIDEQVDDLRERMRLLQGDRRANIDILEANKAANKEEIRRLREDNKDLRVKIAQLQRTGAEETTQSSGGASHELLHMQQEVMRTRKLYDDSRAVSNKDRKALAQLKDEVRDLELEARRPNQEDSPLTRNIRMLENRLDKVCF